jgi:DNA processing protein
VIAARIWVGGGGVSRSADAAGGLQPGGSGGAGNLSQADILAGGEGSGRDPGIGCRVVNWTESEYPQNLLQIYDPPVLLYVRRDATILNAPALGMVGAQMAERISRDLASRGLTIVSGLAHGIDAIAHEGATDLGGRAIGVLGTGIDVCYPEENKKLYEKVLERGAIICEFPAGWHPAPENFPARRCRSG